MAWQPPASDAVDQGWQPPASDVVNSSQGQPINAGLESVAQPIRNIQNAVAPYLQPALSRPEVQPFQGINPFLKPTGTPVQQLGNVAGQVASLPLRWSATLGQASRPVSELTAEKLGGAGVNPYASAAAGMVAGVAADPRSWIPTGGISMEHPNELPLATAQARSARTGVSAGDFQRLYRDPGALSAGGKLQEAGADIGAAKEAAGMSQGVEHGELGTMTPENIQSARSPRAAGKAALDNILIKLSKNDGVIEGSGITPDEISSALKDSNSRLSKLREGTEPHQQESAIKSNLQNILSQISPDVKAANAKYAREKLGQTFAPMQSVNKSGTPSKLGAMMNYGAGAVGGLLGHLIPGLNPAEGAYAGYQAAKLGNQLYHAPYIAGLQTAGGAIADRAINPLMTALEKMGTSPQAQALVARYLQNQNGNQQ